MRKCDSSKSANFRQRLSIYGWTIYIYIYIYIQFNQAKPWYSFSELNNILEHHEIPRKTTCEKERVLNLQRESYVLMYIYICIGQNKTKYRVINDNSNTFNTYTYFCEFHCLKIRKRSGTKYGSVQGEMPNKEPKVKNIAEKGKKPKTNSTNTKSNQHYYFLHISTWATHITIICTHDCLSP